MKRSDKNERRPLPKFNDYAIGVWSGGYAIPGIYFFTQGQSFWGFVIIAISIISMYIPWVRQYFFCRNLHRIIVISCLALIPLFANIINGASYRFWRTGNIYDLRADDSIFIILAAVIVFAIWHSYYVATSTKERHNV